MKTRPTHHLLAALLGVAFTTMLHAQPTDLLLRWTLEEGSGTSTTEAVSGVTNVAHLVGGAVWTNGLAPGSSHAVNLQSSNPGYVDAGTLQTIGDYVTAAAATTNVIVSTQWTIAGWVKLPQVNSIGGDHCIMTSDTDGPNWWLFFVRDYSVPNSLGFDFNSDRIDSGLEVPTGKPVFVSISGDSSALALGPGNGHRFAIWDGQSWQYQLGPQYADIRLDGLEIGSFNNGTRQFEGTLDELRIYDTALSKADLTSLALNNAIGGDLGVTVTAPAALTNSTSLTFTVQFTADVIGFGNSALNITADPLQFIDTPVISGSGSTYTVTLSVQGSGLVSLDLVPGSGVQTLGGNPLVNHVASAAVQVDQTPPSCTAITLDGPNPTAASSVSFNVTFSEPVVGFDDAFDLSIIHSGTANTGATITGSSSNYVVTLTGVTGDGSFTVAVAPAGGTKDFAGNSLSGNLTSAPVTHYVDPTPPYVMSIVPETLSVSQYSNEVSLAVTFSEAVTNFNDYLDLIINATNFDDGVAWSTPTFGPTNIYTVILYNFRVRDGVTNATMTVQVATNRGIADLDGLPLVSSVVSEVIQVSANSYQLWAINRGLTAGVNFDSAADPDLDGNDNATEFMRAMDPLSSGDVLNRRVMIYDIGGTNYLTYTMPMPVGFQRFNFGLNVLFLSPASRGIVALDEIAATADLASGFPGPGIECIEVTPALDGPISGQPDLPALPDTHSYRTMRLSVGTQNIPRGFLRWRTLPISPP